MSVTKEKTLAQLRTFAQDFNAHKPDSEPAAPVPAPKQKQAPAHSPVPENHSEEKKPQKAKTTPRIVVSPKKKKDKIDQSGPQHSATSIEKERLKKSFDKKSAKAKPVQKITVTAKPTPRKKINTGAPANVITATKKAPGAVNRDSFLKGVQKWFSRLFKHRTKTQVPTYQVNTATRRKGVIQKAATKSGAIFTSDTADLRRSISQRQPDKSDDINIIWTPYTDMGSRLLEAADEEQPIDAKSTPSRRPSESDPRSATPHPTETNTVRGTERMGLAEIPEPSQKPGPLEESEPITELPKEPVQPTSAAARLPEKKTSPFTALRELFQGNTEAVSTDALALGIAASIAGVALVVLLAQSMLNLVKPDQTIVTPTEPDPILSSLSVQTYVLNADDIESMQQALADAATIVTSTEAEVQFVDETRTPIAPAQLSTFMNLQLNPNLRENIDQMHVVVIDSVQTGLVFEVTDTFTALGGMLEWESRMRENLDPLLGLIDRPVAALSFTDATANSRDLRVLSDGVDEVLVYGFVDENTILIVPSTESFTRLAD